METAAQHDRLKNEQQWIPAIGSSGQSPSEWSEKKAHQLATQAGVHLSDAHWEVIHFVRDYYLERGYVRRSRELSMALNAQFHDKGGKKYLYRLFRGGPVMEACRLGGVPLPENCLDSSFGTSF